MKYNVFLLSTVVLMVLNIFPEVSLAQQEISSAGGNAESLSGSVSYTIGQPMAVTLPCFNAGVQQVFSIEQVSIDGVEGY